VLLFFLICTIIYFISFVYNKRCLFRSLRVSTPLIPYLPRYYTISITPRIVDLNRFIFNDHNNGIYAIDDIFHCYRGGKNICALLPNKNIF